MKQFGGNVLFLDRSDINTDEIIPAKYLTEISKQALKPYLLEDLKLDGFNPKTDVAGKKVIITRENFGCGSSREHAPWALEVNGIYVVVATNFARIFRQNMYNCGMMAIEMDKKSIEDMTEKLLTLYRVRENTKGIAFEKFLGRTFRGELGQFFTPRTIVEFMVNVLDPQEGEYICDPCCGSGGFLIKAFDYIKEKIEKDIQEKKDKFKAQLTAQYPENRTEAQDIELNSKIKS